MIGRALLVALALGALLAPAAAAQTPGSQSSTQTDPNALRSPGSLTAPPANHRLTGKQAIAIANNQPKVIDTKRHHPGTYPRAFLKGTDRWQVSYYDPRQKQKEVAQVIIDDRSAAATEVWTGFQVPWTMARGYAGAFGRKINAVWIWLPLCVLFFVPFVDRRRPFRLLHLDLLVLLGFSVSLAFFENANIGMSVPLAYPLLAYVLARMLWVAFRRKPGPPAEPIRLLVPATWLAVAIVFLIGFRVGLNVTNSNVIDVGYSGVIGADHLLDGKDLYGAFPKDNEHGDTYGPVNYYAYVPGTVAWPWSGRWDDLPAAHAASVLFDLGTMLLLWLLGRRIRGPTLGIALAYGWAAYPFTAFTLESNANDSLVAMLVVLALLVVRWPAARGASTALAGLSKFAPLGLAPMLATYDAVRERVTLRPRVLVSFVAAFVVTVAVVMLPFLFDGSLHTFYDRTLAYQGDRGSPFSIWGLYGGLGMPQAAVKIAALLLALLLAFVPRRRDVVTLAALGAAVIVALELGITHWFYLYIPWFFPLVLVALLGRYGEPVTPGPPAPAPAHEERTPVPA
ncbi:MAG: hypothetical protein ACJ76R_14380 [Solirubrobacteraceae bacterium]